MRAKLKEFAPVLWMYTAAFTVASSRGWKPIPPPPGMHLLKAPSSLRGVSSEHKLFHEHGFGYHPNETPEVIPDEDSYTHHKFDIFAAPEDGIYAKDNLKAFKPTIQVFKRERKRPSTSYAAFNSFFGKKPTKSVYHEKPASDGIKHPKPFKGSHPGEDKYWKALGFVSSDVIAPHPLRGVHDDHCPLYKVSLRQDIRSQYVQYKVHMPELKEFTICLWSKFHNHSHDHPLFSYAVRHQPKAIYMWVSTTERSNYYNMKIHGHPIFRLNYPVRLNKWYHTCQSWNAKTGEWQVWVNAERIGRGFHNLLVGHVIPGGGIAISGQEQFQYGGGFLEGIDRPKGYEGLMGEITMLQLYRIALTAGKAYTDHRHHHSHYTSTTPEPPDLPAEDDPLPVPEHPFLENGQLKRPLKVFELAESLRPKGNGNADDAQNQPTFTDFFDGRLGQNNYYYYYHHHHLPFGGHHVNSIGLLPHAEHSLFKRNDPSKAPQTKEESIESDEDEREKEDEVRFFKKPSAPVRGERIKFNAEKGSNRNVEGGDANPDWSHRIRRAKRRANATQAEEVTAERTEGGAEPEEDQAEEEERTGREMTFNWRRATRKNQHGKRAHLPRSGHRKKNEGRFTRKEPEERESDPKKVIIKKQVVLEDFRLVPVVRHEFGYPHILDGHYHGDAGREENDTEDDFPGESDEDDKPPQPEPAEEEVRRIMSVCSGCEGDPYRKVAVISWRSTPKKLYSGALFLKARSECRKF